MVTRLYFHNALFTDVPFANLPPFNKSNLTPDDDWDAAENVHRQMTTVIGSNQVSLSNASVAASTLKNYYVTRFVSPKLVAQTLPAVTWTYNFAAAESDLNANFPVAGASQVIYIELYLWRPSTGLVITRLKSGTSSGSTFNEPGGTNTETSEHGVFTAVGATAVDGDVLCLEILFQITQALANSYTQTFYFDGTTVTNVSGTTVSNHASYLEASNDITFIKSQNFGTGAFTDPTASTEYLSFGNTQPTFG